MIPPPDLYLPYTRPCSWCAKPTWWRTMDTGSPICTGCAMKNGRDAVNAVPREVQNALRESESDSPAPRPPRES